MNCPRCNTLLAPEATACPQCGTPVQQAQQPGFAPQQGYPQQQPGFAPQQQPGFAPQQGYPQQPGFAPQQPGFAPQQGYPQQPGFAPQQPGFAPQQPGFYPPPMGFAPKKKSTFILFGLLLGGLGIHDFYAGYKKRGIGHVVVSVLDVLFLVIYILGAIMDDTLYVDVLIIFWVLFFGNGIWALIEVFATKTDANKNPLV